MVSISKLAKRITTAHLLFLGAAHLVGCGVASEPTASVEETVIGEVRVLPESAVLVVGRTVRLSADVRDARGQSVPLPVIWESSDSAVASVDSTGTVYARSSGLVSISGKTRGRAGQSALTVAPVPIASVAVTPSAASILVGGELLLSASPRSASDSALTGRAVTWTSSDTAIARIDGSGRLTGVGAGRVTVSATSEGVVGSASVDVAVPPVGSVATLTATASTDASVTLRFTEVDDGTGTPATYQVRFAAGAISWGSATPASAGTCQSPLVGTTIGAVRSCTVAGLTPSTGYQFQLVPMRTRLGTTTYGPLSNVAARATSAAPVAPVATVALTPATASALVGSSVAFSPVLRDAAGNALTGRIITWSSTNTAVATVSATGVATAVAAGSATIRATSEGVSGQATFTVSAPAPVAVASVVVGPATATATIGGTNAFSATARDAAGNALTGRIITWSSTNTAVATVSATGVATAVAAGSATIRATSEGVSGQATFTVSAPAPVAVASVVVGPATATATIGGTNAFSATARDAAGNALTGRIITWSSTNTAVATVSATGVATAVAAGSATIRATSEGVSGQATFTVSAPAPVPVASVVVGPATATATIGGTSAFSATARDAAGNALTGRIITWSSTNTAVATVSATGVATAVAAGSATIRATSEGVSGQATFTVSAPTTGSPIFAMNYSAGAAPLAGWPGMRADNADHTMTRVAGIGPTGQNGYRMMMDLTSPNGGDNYWGHGGVFNGAPFAYGDRVYFRWRFRWLPGTDCRAYEQGGTGVLAGGWRNKVLIVNDASSAQTSRFIIGLECLNSLSTGGAPRFNLRLMKGGGVDPASTPDFALNSQWVDVQVELQYSSAEGVADGAYRIWINNNTRATPTAEATNIRMYADVTPGYIQFGSYFNNALYPGGLIGWEHIDFQIDDDFHIAWDTP